MDKSKLAISHTVVCEDQPPFNEWAKYITAQLEQMLRDKRA
jgi:hypothetical protein